jgi:hypothetical protein
VVIPKGPVALGLVVTGFVVLAAGSTVLFLFDPSDSDFYPSCPFYALTGLYCPGCGTMRAGHALLHGHLGEALGLNPLMVLMLPLLCYSLMSYVTFGVRGRPLPGVLASPFSGWLVLGTILAYWVLRNIPFYPFCLLAP